MKNYHQQAANSNASDQKIDFIFGENNIHHQIGNAYLHCELAKQKDVAIAANRVLVNGDAIRLVNNAFGYIFKEAILSTTGGSKIEHNKYVGQVSTIMRALTFKDGDLISHFDEIDESEAEIENTSLHHHLINNHEIPANKVKIKGVLPLEHIFGFCKTFQKNTKQLGLNLTLKTVDLQDIIYTTVGDDIKVNFNKFFLFLPIFIPDAQTQAMFNDSIKDSFLLSFDHWTSDRKTVDIQLEYQVEIGSAQNINSPKYLIAVHQTADRIEVSNKTNNVAISDQLNVTKFHVDTDGVRYPRDGVSIDYGLNDYIDQYRDLKLLYHEYLGEQLLQPFISYNDMKTKYLFQVIDLRFQVDHINPKKIQLFEEYRGATKNARLFIILARHREIKMISDGNKMTEVTVI